MSLRKWATDYPDFTLRLQPHTLGYYKTIAASYGCRKLESKDRVRMFFMHNGDLDYAQKPRLEIRRRASLVIVDIFWTRAVMYRERKIWSGPCRRSL